MPKFIPVVGCVRSVVVDDSLRVWEIRNHRLNARYANNKEPIPFEVHSAWFARMYFNGANNHCFVLEISGVTQAFCRLDQKDASYVVSVVVDPDHQGVGIGGYLLKESLKLVQTDTPIIARILKDNIRSIILFVRTGFKLFKEDAVSYYFRF